MWQTFCPFFLFFFILQLENSLWFPFSFPHHKKRLLKKVYSERICSTGSQFLLSRVDPIDQVGRNTIRQCPPLQVFTFLIGLSYIYFYGKLMKKISDLMELIHRALFYQTFKDEKFCDLFAF